MQDKINLLGWSLLFLFTIFGIGYYSLIKADLNFETEKINAYKEEPLVKSKDDPYFGYIYFPNYGVERMIQVGDPTLAIRQSEIGIFGTVPTSLLHESLILVGHNRIYQFAVVLKLKKNDEIIIVKKNKKYVYQVSNTEVRMATDTSFLTNIKNPMLVLITCLDDSSKRLILYAKLK